MRQRAVAAAAAQRTGLRSSSDFLYIGQAEGGCAAGAGFAAYIGQPLGGEEAAASGIVRSSLLFASAISARWCRGQSTEHVASN